MREEGSAWLTVASGSAAGRREGGQVPGSLGSQGEQVGSALWKETLSSCPMVSPCFLAPNWPLSPPISPENTARWLLGGILMLADSRPLLTSPTFQPNTNTLSGLQGSSPAGPLPPLASSWPSPPLTLSDHPSGMGLREWCSPDWSLHLPLHSTFFPLTRTRSPGFHACSKIAICHSATPHISVVLPPT